MWSLQPSLMFVHVYHVYHHGWWHGGHSWAMPTQISYCALSTHAQVDQAFLYVINYLNVIILSC